MYYVNLCRDGKTLVHAPFESKSKAIEYFNKRVDSANHFNFINFDHIYLFDEAVCLFDTEVEHV